ncbi:MFS transporter [Salininema proteolyticum]|uniref:MFS transporter n=1 Tax=Salininema proteolyticum TaxID=1607685 RepID=A0ABV8TSV3_9ACTN
MTTRTVPVARLQTRTLTTLVSLQGVGGTASAITLAVAAIMLEDLTGSTALAGFAQSLFVAGAAIIVIPTVSMTERYGRRGGLGFAYGVAGAGALLTVGALELSNPWLAAAGCFLIGGASCGNLQGRFAGADLAPPDKRATHLSIVVWSVTIGSALGPFLAGPVNTWWSDTFGSPAYTGPLVVTAAASFLAGGLGMAFLRPDPFLLARKLGGTEDAPRKSIADGYRIAKRNPRVRTALLAAATGHMTMVGVMSMTSVHIKHGSPDLDSALAVIGFVISSHIVGMYAFAPVFGRLSDRWGTKRVILLGVALQAVACVVAATAPGDGNVQLTAGLFLLGLGWSAMTLASSAMITEAVEVDQRPSTQGFADLSMGLAAIASGLAGGPIVQYLGYPWLCAILAVPLLAGGAVLARRS